MILALMLPLSGCFKGEVESDPPAVCDGLRPLVDDHVDSLIEDGGPKSRVTGVKLVAGYDGACPK